MLSYEPGETLAHRLDPRSKLCFQFGFAVAALAATTGPLLVGAYAVATASLVTARLSPLRVGRSFAVVLAVLAIAPFVAGVALGPPWFRPEPAVDSLRAVLRIPPVLAVSAVYVATTPIRDTRAAVEWLVPGRPGRLLGVGVALVFRFFPLVVQDLRETRTAVHARGGERRSVGTRARILFVQGLDRTLSHADRLAVALQARCFAWNPTLPELRFALVDYVVLVLGAVLALAPLISFLAGRL